MITTSNAFSGASFHYTNEENCIADGEYRRENGNLVNVNINGQFTKDGETYIFHGSLGEDGNMQVSGVPGSVISDVAAEAAEIVSQIEKLN